MKNLYVGWTICILNKEAMYYGNSQFKANTNYRVQFDEDGKGCLCFGEWMTMRKFKANFLLYIPILQERLNRLGLFNDGKPVSFNDFKERCMTVGRGYINVYIYSHPKENMFAFYPRNTETKPQGLKKAYSIYVDLVQGGWECVDEGLIRWGNKGLPFSGYPSRDELIDHKTQLTLATNNAYVKAHVKAV